MRMYYEVMKRESLVDEEQEKDPTEDPLGIFKEDEVEVEIDFSVY